MKKFFCTLRKSTNNYCAKRDLKEDDIVLDQIDRKNKLEWPIRIEHETLKARALGEKETKVRSVWQRYPIQGDKVTKEVKHLIQHEYTKKGIKPVSLLEEAL